MRLPFTSDQFFAVFRDYNEAVWPAQVMLLGLALVAVALVVRPRPWSDRAVSVILAGFWTWLALAYHVAFFARINPLAWLFAGVSLAGALVFLWQGLVRRRLRFAWAGGVRAATGSALIAFALVVYPLWSSLAGHPYPDMPTFGLPCPTTIFTIGVLSFLMTPCPRSVFIVPVLWCFVGAQAAILLGVPQDFGLIVAGLVGIAWLVRSGRARGGLRLR
jgi:hypothetical protein